MRVDARQYPNEAALSRIGAQSIIRIYSDKGVLTSLDITPDIDLTGYADAAAALARASLMAYAEAKHAALKTGGFAYNLGTKSKPQIANASTTDGGRTDLNGLVALAQMDETFSTIWLQSSGNLTLTAAQIIALGKAVGTFVVETYPALADVLDGIAAGTITTTAQIDAAAWPANAG